jgi:TP901 family phage tail tape measure protein
VASAETAKLIASQELKDQFSKTVNNALGGLTKLDRRIDLTRTKAFQAGQHIGIGIQNAARLGLATVSAGAGIVAASLKVAGDFEAQLNTINTIARASPTELNRIGDSVRKISKDTGTGLADLTQGYYDLLSAGIKTADAQNVLTQANTLAIGGISSTAEAVNLLTGAINVYGGDASKAAIDADVFAKAIERGKVTAADLAGSFSTIGPAAANAGLSIQEVAAGFARLTSINIPAAEAATDMRSALQALTKTTPALEKLQKQTGKNYLSIAGKKGLVEALEQLRKDAAKSGVPMVDLVARLEAMQFILATTGPNFAKYNEDLAAMGNASGTAAAQMGERNKGLNFQVSRLKAIAKDAGITIGTTLLPKIAGLIEKLNAFVSGPAAQAKLKEFGAAIAGLFSDKNINDGVNALKSGFSAIAGVLPTIIEGAKITGAALKIAVDAFRSLPKEIQSLAIAGLAVNKLTGGLVTNIGGSIVGAILGRLRSAVVNVSGAVVNVGGAAGIAGAAGAAPNILGGSRIGAVARSIGKVFIVGAAVGVFAELKGILDEQTTRNKTQEAGVTEQTSLFVKSASLEDMKTSLASLQGLTKDLNNTWSADGFAFRHKIDGVRD